MDIAVIMSVYKNDSICFFAQAFESLLRQKLTPLCKMRIYICLDGFVSGEIEEYLYGKKEHLYYIVQNVTNKGLAYSLNLLIDNLQNEELVFRMDADDISMPNRFQQQIDVCTKNEKLMIVGSNIEKINSRGESCGYTRYPETLPEIWDVLFFRSPFAHPSVVFRRGFFKIIGKYSTRCGANEDLDLWFRAAMMNVEAFNIQENLLSYRVSESFFQRRSKEKAKHELRIYTENIVKRWGISWRLFFPFFRFAFRLLPKPLIRAVYRIPLGTVKKQL